MNPVMETILGRRSVRAYEEKRIGERERAEILKAALRAPTAGNMMLYSIIEVGDQRAKDTLARTCDNQPFIAKAPLVLLFLADYQRWFDYFKQSGAENLAGGRGGQMRTPQEGDLLIACCDALIAAQTAVIAAESMGIGSCYIGDIMENYEVHRDLFDLPQYALPICLVCFGYPTKGQKERPPTPRFDSRFIVFENKYRRLTREEYTEMFRDREERAKAAAGDETASVGRRVYLQKFDADFCREMTRSVRAMLAGWTGEPER